MSVGLLISMTLHAVIGWPDAVGALTFAQRLVGALFLLAAAAQGLATLAVVDHWGRRQVSLSGALVFLGVLIALATTSLLLFMWSQEREIVPAVAVFVSLWVWSIWALYILTQEKIWRQIPHPKKFAAGVTATALLTAVSIGYSSLYQPTSAPVHVLLKEEFGKPQAGSSISYIQIPLKLSAKNDGGIPLYIVVDDYSVYGRSYAISSSGTGMEGWKKKWEELGDTRAEMYVSLPEEEVIASGQFQGPGTTLDPGEEFKMETVVTLPRDTTYETLNAVLSVAILRQDRGKLDDEFEYPKASWRKDSGSYYCPPEQCGEHLVYYGRVRYNNNLINVTRQPRYVAAFWSPLEPPDVFISSFKFENEKSGSVYATYEGLDLKESERERNRYELYWVWGNSEVSVPGLLKQSMP
ncbi:hypothetical protein ACWD4O_02930 [Streptomyces sp. NPDC002623]